MDEMLRYFFKNLRDCEKTIRQQIKELSVQRGVLFGLCILLGAHALVIGKLENEIKELKRMKGD